MGSGRTPPPPHFCTDTPTYPGRTYSSLAPSTTPVITSGASTRSPIKSVPILRIRILLGRVRPLLHALAPAATVPPLAALPEIDPGVDRLAAHHAPLLEPPPLLLRVARAEPLAPSPLQPVVQRPAPDGAGHHDDQR